MDDIKPGNTENKDTIWLIVIVVLIVALLLYAISVGNIDIISEKNNKSSLSAKRRLAAIRHKKLVALIEAKVNLKVKLQRRFKYTYLVVRIVFLCIYAALNFTLYRLFGLKDIKTLFEWNQMILSSFLILNFCIVGSEIKLKGVVDYFKTLIENRVYAKYLNIDEQIAKHRSDLELLVPLIADSDNTDIVEAETTQIS